VVGYAVVVELLLHSAPPRATHKVSMGDAPLTGILTRKGTLMPASSASQWRSRGHLDLAQRLIASPL
ncbi:MAG: hypothetical protein C4331_18500, partial [Meiothermus sp.]